MTITFDEFAVGTIIDDEYAALGVTFAAGAGALPIIADDGAMPDSPVLSPNPPFAGLFEILFPGGATGVSFDSGFWDVASTASVQVYDAGNVLLASITNAGTGVYAFDLSGYGTIGRVVFDSTADPAGGDVDNLTFQAVPEPAALFLLGAGVAAVAAHRRLKRRA